MRLKSPRVFVIGETNGSGWGISKNPLELGGKGDGSILHEVQNQKGNEGY